MNAPAAKARPFRLRPMRIVGTALLAGIAILIALAVLAAWFVWLIMNGRITVNPQTISTLAHDGVVITLDKGTSDQKIQTIQIFEKMGADAKLFVPSLVAAAKEGDPKIRAAALHALESIDPGAAKDSAEAD